MTYVILASVLVIIAGIVVVAVSAPKKAKAPKLSSKRLHVYTSEHGVKPFHKNYEHL